MLVIHKRCYLLRSKSRSQHQTRGSSNNLSTASKRNSKTNHSRRQLNVDISLDIKDGIPVTSSRDVATVFEKHHKDVLEQIREILAAENSADVNSWFFEGNYQDARGIQLPEYLMTKDGFSLLAMGFTGKKALQFKIAFINRFNEMEERLHGAPNDQSIKAFDSDVNLIKTAGILADTLIQSFQVEEGIAKTSVLDMLEDRFNRDFSKIKEILPPSKSKSALLTPTQIGEQFDPIIKPYNVNLWLEHCNLQINISGKWDPTELGKQFAQRTAFTNKTSKHADLQLKWKSDIIDFLRQHPCPVEILHAKRHHRQR